MGNWYYIGEKDNWEKDGLEWSPVIYYATSKTKAVEKMIAERFKGTLLSIYHDNYRKTRESTFDNLTFVNIRNGERRFFYAEKADKIIDLVNQ